MRARPLTALLLLALLTPSRAGSQPARDGTITPPLSPRNASYTIDVRLDYATHTLKGSERIAWRNVSSRTTDELQFHLYWNAWRDANSTFMRERALGGRRERRSPSDWARLDVSAITITERAAPVDVTASKRFISPDDGNPDDATVMAVKLPAPLEPGQTATIDLAWTARVPRTFARTGTIGNFYFIAQWFPKLGVLQDEGWNCHQHHATTEFFSDYGTYDVAMTVPRTWVLGATGVERSRRDNADGTTTHRYYQDDVHDFAWTTSPDYVERTASFASDESGSKLTESPGVALRVLMRPEHLSQVDRHIAAARATLKLYGEWFGPYPYGHLTIVDPAYQSGAGGMEYPTLISAGTRWLVGPPATAPEGVVVHETGHQWWYGMVGSNETEDAWMDEGFNTFATARVVGQAYPANSYVQRYFGNFVPLTFHDIEPERSLFWNRISGFRREPKTDVQSTPTYRYFPATSAIVSYNKTALWLNTMERWLGWPVVQRIMSTFFEDWKFKHPRPQDFFNTVNNVTGRDLGWYFDQVYRSSNTFDYGVQSLDSRRSGNLFRTLVVVRRYGEAVFPVDVLVTFSNGDQVTERWDGKDRWTAYTYDRPTEAVSAAVDPNRVLLLDVNYTNNSKALRPAGPRAATKWSLKWMVWLEDHLLSWAFLI